MLLFSYTKENYSYTKIILKDFIKHKEDFNNVSSIKEEAFGAPLPPLFF